MIRSSIKELLLKKFENSLSEIEKADLLVALYSYSDEELVQILNEICISKNLSIDSADVTTFNSLSDIYTNILLDERLNDVKNQKRTSRKILIFKILSLAAVLLLAIGIVLEIQFFSSSDKKTESIDVFPAIAKATITLDNGDEVRIDSTSSGLIYSKGGLKVFVNEDGEVVYEDISNSRITSSLTVITPKGGYTKLKLSDSTVIELNSATTLRYPVVFDNNKREVYLEGEAYFEVMRDKSKPFFVHSEKQSIEVLGTKFNLKTSDKLTKTILLEGSVKIIAQGKDYLLKPGQEALVGEFVDIRYMNSSVIQTWANDKFIFDNSSFIEILKEIEDWYDVKMVFIDTHFENTKLSGTITKKVRLSEILHVIELNTNYKFTLEERRVLIKHL